MTDFWANTASRPTLFGQTVTTLEEGDMEPRSEAGEWQKEWPFDPILPSISEADEARQSALDAVAEAVGRLPEPGQSPHSVADCRYINGNADAALIVEAVNAYDRLRRIEAAARALVDTAVGKGGPKWEALSAALAATPPADASSPTRLDERRLARAMGWGPGPVSGPELARAHRVAVKYAALEEKP